MADKLASSTIEEQYARVLSLVHIAAHVIVICLMYFSYLWATIELYPLGQSLLDTPPTPTFEPSCKVVFTIVSVSELSVEVVMNASMDSHQLFVMRNGENVGKLLSWDGDSDDTCLLPFAKAAAKALDCDSTDAPQVFSQMGFPLSSWVEVVAAKVVHIVLLNQVWVWPGIKVGHTWHVDGTQLRTLSMEPKVILVTDFLTDDECSAIIAGQELLAPSGIVSHEASEPQRIRTSSTAFIGHLPIAVEVKQRAAKLARLPSESYVEDIQLVRYSSGQWFRAHTDYFQHLTLDTDRRAGASLSHWIEWVQREASTSQLQPDNQLYPSHTPEFELTLAKLLAQSTVVNDFLNLEWKQWLAHHIETESPYIISSLLAAFDDPKIFIKLRQLWEHATQIPSLRWLAPVAEKYIEPNRHATLFLYLNSVDEGGETVFPYASTQTSNAVERSGMPECSVGLQVKPKKRSGALFYNKKPTGENDPYSTHGGCPPVNGTKWGSNVFMWNVDATYGNKKWKFW